ncbi:hypothetical protein F3Y22_tig00111388pilonHSYRG00097 [Hibiscus syriacus]|uniref:Uncharacterized protein n=1 Tax=Hibiscus syriacus TaxID=106335 RepID=A0A6A2YM83_HIBSY|nr:hypothetical protein F3Y22_tig00111388pilonHSYRG00097 [Hibiscus syriacus]
MAWPDSRQENSVIYVCFGSRQVLTRKQADELAAGLEKAGSTSFGAASGDSPTPSRWGVFGTLWVEFDTGRDHGCGSVYDTKLSVNQLGVGIRVGESSQNIPECSTLARVLVESVDGSRAEGARVKQP